MQRTKHADKAIVYIYNCIIFPSLNYSILFESIPDEPLSTSCSVVWQITCAVINTSNEI